ncbi:hypothetical protein AGMMS50268_03210 [Spirochaetia bacterium]|nr:hypothetical protein AGMMS50268_03210 [Spirochaetia bacterium]
MDDSQKQVIMAVDDLPTNLAITKAILEDLFDLRLCESARAAMEILDKEKISLILLDIEMPEMSGFEFLQQLRQNPDTREIPVIFVTSYISTEFIDRAIASGAEGYIVKPLVPDTLIKRINAVLGI